MNISIKLYSCYELTYTPVLPKIIDKLYEGKIDFKQVKVNVIDVSCNGTITIQSQRSKEKYASRTLEVYEDENLVHIVAFSNTNYDEDKHNEFLSGKSIKKKDSYGVKNYHANTYLKQGSPAIFNYYYEQKKFFSNVQLSFYLLDIRETYPHNLFNILSYRELETIGFKILNLDEVNFNEYNNVCHSNINQKNIKFSNLNKYIRDISYISKKNTGNTPSFLICEETEVQQENGDDIYYIEKYIYTFKSLSAQGYDSLFRCWCLKTLVNDLGEEIEFRLGKQYFAFDSDNVKVSDKLTGPILKTFKNANIDINYVTNEEFMKEILDNDTAYEKHKKQNKLRNQLLFRNNLRKTGIPCECVLCGEENSSILEAAHIWEVNKIQDVGAKEINEFINKNDLLNLIDENSAHKNELFFKKYCLVNSGENGIWLCKNHHGLFDKNYYCFDSEDGKILLHFKNTKDLEEFLNNIDNGAFYKMPASILTKERKAFIKQRQTLFEM